MLCRWCRPQRHSAARYVPVPPEPDGARHLAGRAVTLRSPPAALPCGGQLASRHGRSFRLPCTSPAIRARVGAPWCRSSAPAGYMASSPGRDARPARGQAPVSQRWPGLGSRHCETGALTTCGPVSAARWQCRRHGDTRVFRAVGRSARRPDSAGQRSAMSGEVTGPDMLKARHCERAGPSVSGD